MLGQCFDPKSEWLIHEHCRPHWSQAGALVFITFRTNDSIPEVVIERWEQEKREWLGRRGWNCGSDWSAIIPMLTGKDRVEFQQTFDRCREEFLDSGHGRCLLKRPDLAKIVADSLLHFDGLRDRMGDFIVMPNHVHLLAAFRKEDAMKDQCDSWLHYTAFRINRAIGERGKFWQQEPFDHLVRSPEQYDYLRQYIEDNPNKAGLMPGEYLYRRLNES
jgi:type I restriction enzyme R subunit